MPQSSTNFSGLYRLRSLSRWYRIAPAFSAAHINGFLVRAPYRIQWAQPPVREAGEVRCHRPRQCRVWPLAVCLTKRQVKIVRRPSPVSAELLPGPWRVSLCCHRRCPTPRVRLPMCGERDVHHALSVRRYYGLSCFLRHDVRRSLRMNVVSGQKPGGSAIYKVNPFSSWSGMAIRPSCSESNLRQTPVLQAVFPDVCQSVYVPAE